MPVQWRALPCMRLIGAPVEPLREGTLPPLGRPFRRHPSIPHTPHKKPHEIPNRNSHGALLYLSYISSNFFTHHAAYSPFQAAFSARLLILQHSHASHRRAVIVVTDLDTGLGAAGMDDPAPADINCHMVDGA